ncbi:unnamed protein product [Mytilus coruscus]|uniref:Uncharacterized protein n=1 Tax=Mytilus coruscus TaxID=42192 RepID=A0A6J8A9M5_MYTCO|nr:unnamed protein product [Mytilus coruscus]
MNQKWESHVKSVPRDFMVENVATFVIVRITVFYSFNCLFVHSVIEAGKTYSSEKQSTLLTTSQRTSSTGSTTGNTSVFEGLHRREIIVYSICTGLVSLILLVCTFLLRRYKQRGANTRPFLHGTTPEQTLNDIGLHEQATGISTEVGEGFYETIDESSLLPDLPISMHTRNESNESSGSSSDDNSDPLPTDGYLNPYQPMAQEFEMHGYSAIVDKNDSDCSSSCKDDRVSGYLNPYQMIVQDQEKHEYLKVNDDSCLEKNNVSDYSNQSPTGQYTDAHSYNTSGKCTGPEENENECEKMKSHVYENNYDIDEKVNASIFIEENEMNHDENQQTCDIKLKRYIGGHEDSSEKLKKIDHYHEVSGSGETSEATCHLNVI